MAKLPEVDFLHPQIVQDRVDEDTGEFYQEIVSSGLDRRGREVPDPHPIEIPAGFNASPSLQDLIQRHLRQALAPINQSEPWDTEEEAADFDVEDEQPDPTTIYEAMGRPVSRASPEPQPVPPGAPAGGVQGEPPPAATPSTATPTPPGGPSGGNAT